MERMVGTVVRGIRTPIINKDDNLVDIVVDSVIKASRAEGFSIQDRDIVGITESVVARAQGVMPQLMPSKDVGKLGGGTVE